MALGGYKYQHFLGGTVATLYAFKIPGLGILIASCYPFNIQFLDQITDIRASPLMLTQES